MPAMILLFGAAVLAAQPTQSRLPETIQKLNAASAHFSNARASFKKDIYTALVKDHEEQDGSIYFVRAKCGHTEMGAKITGAGARTVEYKNGTVRDWNQAAVNCVDSYSAGANQSKLESLLTLGFGGSGTDLEKAWTIDDQGPDTVDGVKVERLDLVPKDAGLKGSITHVTLWLDLTRGVSLKQVFFMPSGDTQTAIYSKIETNLPKLDTKAYEIKAPNCGAKAK